MLYYADNLFFTCIPQAPQAEGLIGLRIPLLSAVLSVILFNITSTLAFAYNEFVGVLRGMRRLQWHCNCHHNPSAPSTLRGSQAANPGTSRRAGKLVSDLIRASVSRSAATSTGIFSSAYGNRTFNLPFALFASAERGNCFINFVSGAEYRTTGNTSERMRVMAEINQTYRRSTAVM